MYLVYILKSQNKSYIGMTNDFFKRWKQHNKLLKGGAKYTSKYLEIYKHVMKSGKWVILKHIFPECALAR